MIMDEVKKIFTMDGKSTRSEYWAVNLVCYFLLILAGVISSLMTSWGFIGFVFIFCYTFTKETVILNYQLT